MVPLGFVVCWEFVGNESFQDDGRLPIDLGNLEVGKQAFGEHRAEIIFAAKRIVDVILTKSLYLFGILIIEEI